MTLFLSLIAFAVGFYIGREFRNDDMVDIEREKEKLKESLNQETKLYYRALEETRYQKEHYERTIKYLNERFDAQFS